MNTLLQKRKQQFKAYAEFHRTHKRHPRFSSTDKTERKLARFRIYYTAQLRSNLDPSHYVKQLFVFDELTAIIKRRLPSFFKPIRRHK